MAPSIIQNMFKTHYYDEKIDIWSLGIVCYEMLFGKTLFSNMNKNEIINNILLCNFKIPKTISVQAKTFLLSMLQKDGINRLSASQLLNHPFIIGDYHYFTRYINEPNININNYINKYGHPFPEKLVQRLMKKILTGVNFLHQKGIIHRDLKLGNILVKYENEFDKNIYSAEIKIIDFNCSYIYGTSKPKTIVGTPQYMAPSIIQNMFTTHYYDEKIDIWSLGIVCYEMLFGKALFSNMNANEIKNNILLCNFKIPKIISVKARTFLLSMLKKDGINRLSASQLLNHPFIIGDYHYFTKYINEPNINNNNYLNNQNKIIINTVNPQYNQKLRLNYTIRFEKICDGMR